MAITENEPVAEPAADNEGKYAEAEAGPERGDPAVNPGWQEIPWQPGSRAAKRRRERAAE